MLKTLRKFMVGLAFVATQQAHALPVVINFDDYGSGTLITDQFADLGVTFANSSISNYFTNGIYSSALASALDGGAERVTGYIDILFSGTASNVSFEYNNYGNSNELGFIQAFGLGNNLLETLNYSEQSYSGMELLSFSANNIARIRVTAPVVPTWLVAIDNLTFELNEVPEPGSLALLGLAFAGLGLSRKRQSR